MLGDGGRGSRAAIRRTVRVAYCTRLVGEERFVIALARSVRNSGAVLMGGVLTLIRLDLTRLVMDSTRVAIRVHVRRGLHATWIATRARNPWSP